MKKEIIRLHSRPLSVIHEWTRLNPRMNANEHKWDRSGLESLFLLFQKQSSLWC